jgi:NADH-ubiquinone oxidoreductase chain 5
VVSEICDPLFIGFGSFFVFSAFLFLFFLLSFFGGGDFVEVPLFSYLGMDLRLIFVFDFLRMGFFGCVSLISGFVFLYRFFYMWGSLDQRRFVLLVSLFVASICLLVFSGNFFLTMVGWDGLGLVSFCLVVFYGNSTSLESGLITVFSNRVGDVFFLLSFFFFRVGGYWGFDFFGGKELGVFVVLLFLGAITKRAQLPFSA